MTKNCLHCNFQLQNDEMNQRIFCIPRICYSVYMLMNLYWVDFYIPASVLFMFLVQIVFPFVPAPAKALKKAAVLSNKMK